MASGFTTVHAAVRAALTTALAGQSTVRVIDGPGRPTNALDLAWVSRLRADVEPATLAGSTRPTDEQFEATVILSSGRNGTEDAQAACRAQVGTMYSLLFEHIRANPTLGVSANTWAHVSGFDSEPSDNPDVIEKGRNETMTVTISIRVRV